MGQGSERGKGQLKQEEDMEGQEEVFDEPSGFEQLFCLNLQGEEGKDEVYDPKSN